MPGRQELKRAWWVGITQRGALSKQIPMPTLQTLGYDELRMIMSGMRLCDLQPLSRTSASLRQACAGTIIELANQDRAIKGALNQRQQQAYVEAVLFGRNIFITGGAGVGKSHVLHRIVRGLALMELSRQPTEVVGEALGLHPGQIEAGRVPDISTNLMLRDMDEASRRVFESSLLCMQQGPKTSVAITASTGTAAQLINGLTLHSCLGIAVRDEGDATEEDDALLTNVAEDENDEVVRPLKRSREGASTDSNPTVRRLHRIGTTFFSKKIIPRIRKLLIDEISMVSADLMDAICLGLRNDLSHIDDVPFGGVQLIAVGDWLQLPPVLPESRDATTNGSNSSNSTLSASGSSVSAAQNRVFAFESNAWRWMQPTVIELTEVMRQDASEQKFVEILNEMRQGRLSIRDARWLSENAASEEAEEQDPYITLFHRVNDVRRENNARLEGLDAQPLVFLAEDRIKLSILQEVYSQKTQKYVGLTIRNQIDETINTNVDAYISLEDANVVMETQRRHLMQRCPQIPAFAMRPPRALADLVYVKMGCRVRCTRNVISYSESFDNACLEVANGRTGTVAAFLQPHLPPLVDLSTLRRAAVATGKAEASEVEALSTEELVSRLKLEVDTLYVLWDALDSESLAYFCAMRRAVNRRNVNLADSSLSANERKRVQVTRSQYPLEVCYAKTVHQSQGSTILDRVDMDLVQVTYRERTYLSNGSYEEQYVAPKGLLYTALSRVKSLKLIKFLKTLPSRLTHGDGRLRGCVLAPQHVCAHEKALEYYARFQTPPLPRWVGQV